MKAVVIIAGIFHIVFDSAVYVRVADGVPDVVAEIAAQIGNGLLPLLSGLNLGQMILKQETKKSCTWFSCI